MMRITTQANRRAFHTTSIEYRRERPKRTLEQYKAYPYKPFILNRDETGPYYTVNENKRLNPPLPPLRGFFQISDLLLDLDDIDSKSVRPMTEEDEAALEKKWKNSDPAVLRLDARILEIQRNLEHSRAKASQLTDMPMNPWRPTDHDLLSVALRGPPEAAPLIDSGEMQRDAGALTARGGLDPRNLLHKVCHENGVSDYALQKEHLLLHWFRSRQGDIKPGLEKEGEASSRNASLFVKHVKQGSIAAIRRVVSQSLSPSFFEPTLQGESLFALKKISTHIREACSSALSKLGPRDPSRFEALVLLGNLQQRLSLHEGNIGGPLCGLGLRISAEVAHPQATFSYLSLGFKHGLWEDQRFFDVCYALETYISHLTSAGSSSMDAWDRVILLDMLTGTGDEEFTSSSSLRTIVLYAGFASMGSTATRLYRAYLMLLGRLGAVATLWKEWELSSNQAEQQQLHERRLDFANAAREALSVVAQRTYAVPTGTGLVACATLDKESIESQNDFYVVPTGAGQMTTTRIGENLVEALGLPLDGWLEQVQAVAGKYAR